MNKDTQILDKKLRMYVSNMAIRNMPVKPFLAPFTLPSTGIIFQKLRDY
jgi:hypothetical protein